MCSVIALLLTSCSETSTNANPGFVELDRVDGQTESQYYSNFDEPTRNSYRSDPYKEPQRADDQRVVKINADDGGSKSGTIVVNDGSGVGYIYDNKKKKKKEVVVMGDGTGDLWAVDNQGNTYPVAVAEENK